MGKWHWAPWGLGSVVPCPPFGCLGHWPTLLLVKIYLLYRNAELMTVESLDF